MKFKYLPIISLFVCQAAQAQVTLTEPVEMAAAATLATEPKVTAAEAEELPEPIAPAPMIEGVGITKVSFFVSLGAGLARPIASYGGKSVSGAGRKAYGDLGVKIPVGQVNYSARSRFVSISVGITGLKLTDEYAKEGPAGSINNEFYVTSYCMPLSFTSATYIFSDDWGYYWQAGATLHYVSQVDNNKKSVSANFNKFTAEPFISIGIAGTQYWRFKSSNDVHSSKLFIGPYASYNPMNLMNVNGSSLRYFTFGLMLTSVL